MDDAKEKKILLFCTKCGKRIDGSFTFCPFCGNEVVLPEELAKEFVSEQEERKAQEPGEEKVQEPIEEKVQEPIEEKVQEPIEEKVQEPVEEKGQEPATEKLEEEAADAHKEIRKNNRKGLWGLIALFGVLIVGGIALALYLLTNGFNLSTSFNQKKEATKEAGTKKAGTKEASEEVSSEVIKAEKTQSGIDSSEWKAAYASFLEKNCPESDFQMNKRLHHANLYYVDGDDVPELVIITREEGHEYFKLYYYDRGSVREGISFEMTRSDIYNDLPNTVYYYPNSNCIVRAYCYDVMGIELNYDTAEDPEVCSLTYFEKTGKELGSYYRLKHTNRSTTLENGERLQFEVDKIKIDNLPEPGSIVASLNTSYRNEEKLDITLLKNAAIGDYVIFGAYEQDGLENGKEAMEWQILDRQGGRILLLSKYAVEVFHFENDVSSDYGKKEIPEKQMELLREKLNGYFYQTAFQENERQLIIPVKNKYSFIAQDSVLEEVNGAYQSKRVYYFKEDEAIEKEDYVFVLSCQEVDRYFGTDSLNSMRTFAKEVPETLCYPTAYIASMAGMEYTVHSGGLTPGGSKIHENSDFDYSCGWILRDGYMSNQNQRWIYDPGLIEANSSDNCLGFGIGAGAEAEYSIIRPAIWVNIE